LLTDLLRVHLGIFTLVDESLFVVGALLGDAVLLLVGNERVVHLLVSDQSFKELLLHRVSHDLMLFGDAQTIRVVLLHVAVWEIVEICGISFFGGRIDLLSDEIFVFFEGVLGQLSRPPLKVNFDRWSEGHLGAEVHCVLSRAHLLFNVHLTSGCRDRMLLKIAIRKVLLLLSLVISFFSPDIDLHPV